MFYTIRTWIFILVPAALGLVFAVMGVNDMRENQQFAAKGKIATLIPTGEGYTEHTSKRGRKSYSTDMAFMTESGERVELPNLYVSADEIEQIKNQGSIQRKYLPSLPTRTRRVGEENSLLGGLFLSAGAFFQAYRQFKKLKRPSGLL